MYARMNNFRKIRKIYQFRPYESTNFYSIFTKIILIKNKLNARHRHKQALRNERGTKEKIARENQLAEYFMNESPVWLAQNHRGAQRLFLFQQSIAPVLSGTRLIQHDDGKKEKKRKEILGSCLESNSFHFSFTSN